MEQGMWKTVLKTWNVPILLKPVVAWEIFVYTILSKWQKCKSNNIKYSNSTHSHNQTKHEFEILLWHQVGAEGRT